MKVKLTAEQRKVIATKMKETRKYTGHDRDVFMARVIGDVYDVEIPVNEVITSIARVEKAEVGEHVYYLAPTTKTKEVNTITSDCTITQVKVTPDTLTEVTWTDLVSKEVYVCLHNWLKADHNVLQFNADALAEAMDRQEIYAVLQLVEAGAVSESNTYALRSGQTRFVYPDLVDMARSIAKYGKELVLITGGTITTDIMMMNYYADKNKSVDIFDVVKKHIAIEELDVTIDSVNKTVLAANVAYVVAVADAKNNRSLVVARRKTAALNEMFDTEDTGDGKERVVVASGNGINVGSARKYAKGFFIAEEYSATCLNDKTFAKFTRS